MEEQHHHQQDDVIGLKIVVDEEEGEMSDSASIEEITEDGFNKDKVRVAPRPPPKEKESSVSVNIKPKTETTRVWTMQDLYSKYPRSRDYAAGLYNFAWAQAVQNKPLNQVFVMDVVDSEVVSSSTSSVNAEEVKVINVDSCDELEEGEIDLDSEEATPGNAAVDRDGFANVDVSKIEMEDKLLEEKVNTIRDVLQSVTVVEAEKSFDEVCSRLHNTLESLQLLFLKNVVPNKDALIQLSFSGIQMINSVFCSLDLIQKEQYKEIYSRLISVVIKQDRPIFSPERIKEIEAMAKDKPSISADASASPTHNEGQNLNSEKKLESISADLTMAKNNLKVSETSKPGLSSLRAKWNVAPLLDLHKDHDSDSLPSPTRDSAPFFPLHKSVPVREGMPKLESVTAFKLLDVGEGMPKPEAVTPFKPESSIATVVHKEDVSSVMRPYVTEAIKAVSTYQQKFGQTSLFANDRFPSPTPSEESANKEDEDIIEEISSSYTAVNLNNINSAISARPTFAPTPHLNTPSPHLNNLTVPEALSASDVGFVGSAPNSTVKTLSKSRDPRLRFARSTVGALKVNPLPMPVANSTSKLDHVGGTVRLRTNNTVEEPLLEGPAHKRQRNESTNSNFSRDATTVSGSGGWFEDVSSVGPKFLNGNHLIDYTSNDPMKMDTSTDIIPSIVASGAEKMLGAGTSASSTATAFPLLLKDIAVNPAMLLNLLKMGQQQKLSSDVQQKPCYSTLNPMLPLVSNSVIGSDPLTNIPSLKSLGFGQSSVGTLQVSSQGGPTDEVGKIRMKPRDPRRFLHATTQNTAEQCKTNGTSTLRSLGNKDEVNTKKLEDQSNKHSSSQPDIARLFTKNLKNIADLVSSSQTTAAPLVVSHSSDKVDVKDVNVESDEWQTGTASMPGEVVVDPLKSKNTWGYVEHLFEGFDDKQKAAIQRERSRRLEEQNKMFAARKLCLVLDLDHTLLNSAKFGEVDPVHDEILRKKEEQDREKPQRHLFRFPYMGMWTKLRPGVWNFLEKASRLFEMHLYTMGNKLYATEMAKILDPKGELFAGRVISRGDDGDLIDGEERVPKSKDLEGVLGMESAVVIIDDSVRVWPRNKLNLIVVERYTYFPCSRRQFGLPGPSLLEIDHDERPEDGTLASCSAVIDKIHQTFFFHRSLDEADVRNILASEQQKILGGCRILFSRVFPVGEAKPHLHPLWQTAEQFGAVCTNHIDEQVTHVVANSLGTDKVNWALSTGRFVVHPGWVEASALLYRRVNEEDFSVKQ